MQIPNNSVVLVADGRKSLFFRNKGDSEFPNFVVENMEVRLNPPHHEQASDLAGRTMSPDGTHHGSMVEVDFHRQKEDRFAADMAETLKARALRNDYDALVVVAPAATLGQLRKHYHKAVEQRLIAEVPKDMVNLQVPEIEKALKAE
jgi:protein required for attachment to host cells